MSGPANRPEPEPFRPRLLPPPARRSGTCRPRPIGCRDGCRKSCRPKERPRHLDTFSAVAQRWTTARSDSSRDLSAVVSGFGVRLYQDNGHLDTTPPKNPPNDASAGSGSHPRGAAGTAHTRAHLHT